jgi:transcriptional regulator NrdR family protein
MNCPKCDSNNVTVSATATYPTVVWRRRRCKVCDHRWLTSEMEDEPLDITFDRLKIEAPNGSK